MTEKLAHGFITLTEDAWIELYRPKPKTKGEDYGFDFGDGPCMYETFGEDLEYLKQLSAQGMGQHIWTVIDGDEGTVIESGVHLVNRLGYIVTEHPWDMNTVITVELEDLTDSDEQ